MNHNDNSSSIRRTWVLRYGLAFVAVAAGFGLRAAVTAWIGPGLPTYITFYPAVMAVALLAGIGPGLLATALTIVVVGYWILPPVGQFAIASPVDRVGLALFAGMGLFMSVVAELYRRNRRKAAAYDQEAAMRETRREKEFLADVLEHTSQAFAVGYPDGRLGMCNRAYEQLTGYSAEELRIIDWATKLTPPEWRELERLKLEELHLNGQPVRYEKEYIRKDGTRVPIELLVHLVKDAGGKPEYYYSFITDITERKRVEEATRLLSGAVEAAANGIAITDREGKILWVNAAFTQLTGYTSAEAVGQNPRALKSGQHPPEFYRQMWSTILLGEVWHGELLNKRKDGSLYPEEMTITPVLAPGGKITHFIAVKQDITERKRVEEALRQSEERYRTMFDTMLEGFCIIEVLFDADNRPIDYRFLEVNAAFEAQTGLRDAQGKRMRELAPEHEAHWFEIYGKVALTGEPARFVNEAKALNRWYDVSAYRVGGRDSRKIVILFNDITKRQQAEEALRESRERLGLALIASRMATFDWDIINNKRTWSDGVHSLLGTKPETFTGKAEEFFERIHPEDRSTVQAALARAVETTGVYETEYRAVWPDGSIYHIAARGKVHRDKAGQAVLMTGVCWDITKRQQAEEALRKLNEELEQRVAERTAEVRAGALYARNLIETSLDPLVTISKDGKITDVNHATELATGVPRERLIGSNFSDYFTEPDQANAGYQKVIAEGLVRNYPLTIRHVAGHTMHVLYNAAVYHNEAGQVQGVFAAARDITERKRMEDAHTDLQRHLVKAQETERGRISRELHDRLGQDLTALKLGLQLVKKQEPFTPSVQASIGQLEQLADRLMQDIHRLAWELRPAALDDFGLDMALRRYASEWSEQNGVAVDFHSHGVETQRLPTELETTLYRITQEALTNVLRHAKAHHVGVILERRPDHVLLIVEDDGQGFDAQAALKAPGAQGRLGLLGMHERVILANGTIEIESTPRAGTTVFVRIPLESKMPAVN
jgi:PAS domain S-box-containing protein